MWCQAKIDVWLYFSSFWGEERARAFAEAVVAEAVVARTVSFPLS